MRELTRDTRREGQKHRADVLGELAPNRQRFGRGDQVALHRLDLQLSQAPLRRFQLSAFGRYVVLAVSRAVLGSYRTLVLGHGLDAGRKLEPAPLFSADEVPFARVHV